MGAQQSVYNNRIESGRSVNKNQSIISKRQQRMSRNNVFKLSGNMALGAQDNYNNNDFQNIKSSLKLLKSKQPQKRSEAPLEPTNLYGGSYSSNTGQRQQPNSKKYVQQDYGNYNYQPTRNQQPSYKDVYHQMEQHYPSNNPPAKKKYTQDYQQPTLKDRNSNRNPKYTQDYQQPTLKDRNNNRNPRQQQPPKPSYKQPSYQDDYDYRMPKGRGDNFDNKAIKEVNRDNRVEIVEYDPSQLVMCRQGCGRKFNPDSIKKHQAICRKVFQKKRKEFDAQQHRIVANEQTKLMKKGQIIDKKLEKKKAQQKVPKWKQESLQLRAGIKQAQNPNHQPTKEERRILEQAAQAQRDSMIKCHTCGRTFNEKAAQKHIPFCESQAKKNQMRRR